MHATRSSSSRLAHEQRGIVALFISVVAAQCLLIAGAVFVVNAGDGAPHHRPQPREQGHRVLAAEDGVAPRWPATRILLVSGHTQDAALLGVSLEFLHKPFSRDDLARAVRRVLDA